MIPSKLSALFLAVWIVAGAPPTPAQNVPAPVPTNLDEMIATALKASPEVLLAEAKLRQAQAELNQARLKVTREVVGAFSEKKQRQNLFAAADRHLKETTKQSTAGTAS